MKRVLLKNCRLVFSSGKIESTNILIEDGRIADISSENSAADEIINVAEHMVFAGFIDIHNHGAVGVSTNTGNVDDFIEIGKFLAQKGIAAWMPTFVPDADDNYQKQISVLEQVRKLQEGLPIAQVVGVHYEGVFANTQMCGALHPQFFKIFTGSELNDLPTLKDAVCQITYAPEIEGGIELTKELVTAGWIPAIGHTKADLETLDNAFTAGAKHITHLFNAMTGLHHRDLGVAGWALTKDEISCEIIADGIHVHPKILKLAAETKPFDKMILVSDSVSPTGMGDGDFEIWGENVSVRNKRTRNERGNIAGSVITMHDAVCKMLDLGFSASRVSRMASLNPAVLLGIANEYGSIEIGKCANLVVLDESGNILLSYVNGGVAFSGY